MTTSIATNEVKLRSPLLLHGLGAVLVVLIFAVGNYSVDLSATAQR